MARVGLLGEEELLQDDSTRRTGRCAYDVTLTTDLLRETAASMWQEIHFLATLTPA